MANIGKVGAGPLLSIGSAIIGLRVSIRFAAVIREVINGVQGGRHLATAFADEPCHVGVRDRRGYADYPLDEGLKPP